jgi:hypothetical protein
MKIDLKNLPKDLKQCHAIIGELVTQLDAKERRLKRVLHFLEKLLRWRYGAKRERVDENQLTFPPPRRELHRRNRSLHRMGDSDCRNTCRGSVSYTIFRKASDSALTAKLS